MTSCFQSLPACLIILLVIVSLGSIFAFGASFAFSLRYWKKLYRDGCGRHNGHQGAD